jgi:hypothetical protein
MSCLLGLLLVASCGDDGYVAPDAAPGTDAGPRPDAMPTCQGDNNGSIARTEMPMVPGVTVDYLVNAPGAPVTVSPGGSPDGAGGYTWDFTSEAGQVFSLSMATVVGAWFESSFVDAHYAAAMAPGDDTLGVYRATDDAIWLLGYASPDAERTLAVYDPPVPLIRFPVSVGQSWVVQAEIKNAVFDGLPFASTDTWRLSVDRRGTVVLPYLSLENSLRLKVELVQSLPGGQTLHRFQYLYLHECWGELARVVSEVGELSPEFTSAAEFRRLALP